ncbi:MAG: ferredoxin family protein [Chloroflexota bacterium]
MTHIIFDKCIRDGACVEVCPVECIIPGEPEADWPWYFIDPETCIDCGACVPECPTEAILPEEDMEDKDEHTFLTFDFIAGMSEEISGWLVERGDMVSAADAQGDDTYESDKPVIGGEITVLSEVDGDEDVLRVSATDLNYAYFNVSLPDGTEPEIGPGYPE